MFAMILEKTGNSYPGESVELKVDKAGFTRPNSERLITVIFSNNGKEGDVLSHKVLNIAEMRAHFQF